VIGEQTVKGRDFRIVREVETGSWIGMRHQGRGIGTEMRAAVLAFAFDHLGAVRARSGAFADNVASRRVSERLGYRADGSNWFARRGRPAEELRLTVTPGLFVRPGWTLQVEGVDACRGLLGAD
jgi:RimJ/RimL family protein N-acetyltransferase